MPSIEGSDLKDYLAHLFLNLRDEYNDQIEDWKLYIEKVVGVASDASDSVKQTLIEANAEKQAAEEAAFGIGMLLLGLVVGPAVSWIGGMVKSKWAPKFTASTRIETELGVAWQQNGFGKIFEVYTAETKVSTVKNEVLDAVLGDSAKAVGNWLFGKLQVLMQAPRKTDPKQFRVDDWTSMKTGLLETLRYFQRKVTSDMQGPNNAIYNDSKMGDKILAQLFREKPSVKYKRDQWEDEGQKLLNRSLNDQRILWAKRPDWFYYANDPPEVISDLVRQYKLKVWAVWLLNEKFQIKREHSSGIMEHGPAMPSTTWYVKSDSGLVETRAVRAALSELGFNPYRPHSTWDPQLADAAYAEGLPFGSEELAKKALSNLLNWANTHVGGKTALSYGTARVIQQDIQYYESRYDESYKDAEQNKAA
jgi:hypothetical protein